MKTIRYDFYFILKCFANFIIQGRIYIFQMFTNKNSVLKNRNFMLLLFGKIVSQLGNWVYYLAIIYFITQVTKSTASTGIILFFNAVPVIMFGAIAGSVCKRYSKKFILVFSDYISGFLSLYLGVKALTGDISLIEASIITFLLGVSKSFFTPALLSAIPTIVDESELNRANSLIKSTNSVTNILGPLIGGTMIMLIGCPIAFILNGISFIISAISEMFIEIPNSNNKNEKLRWYKNIVADFVEGMNFVKSNRLIYNILIVFSIMTFFASPMVLIFHQLVVASQNILQNFARYFAKYFAFFYGSFLISLPLTNTKLSNNFFLKL
ncbi:MFS transporter [Caloranaerobacter sp. DY30410]|uniref:MFS transporter n=1 Tax=Caloranaerobacter sp. DY30410 TaxID=3238305 RepID=UPI003D02A357